MSYPSNQPTVTGVDDGQLRAFVERIERLFEEKTALEKDIADVYAEAGSTGFDKKALRAIIAERRKDPTKLAEFETILDLYRASLSSGRGA